MRLYVPPERWDEEQDHDKTETYNPRRPFVLAPCNICGITECGKEEDGHGSPIIIAISGVRHRSTSACAVFCNINSPYNKTTLLHQPNYSVPQVELKAAVLALEQVKAFIAAEATEEAVTQTRQIIIKTDSIYITADKKTRSRLKKCKHLVREFNELLTDLDELQHGKVSVRFWRVSNERNRMAQQLAETKLAGHEETRDIRRLLYGKLEQAGWRHGVIPFAERFKNKYKPKPRASKKPQPLETESDKKQTPFTLAPCQICGIIECGNTSAGHESPIIISISSKGASPAACSVFFKENSLYNQTFLIHDEHLSRREIQISTAITALKQIYAYVTAKPKKCAPPTKHLTNIIIETNSKWLVKWFAVRKTSDGGQFHYGKLSDEFDKVLNDIGKRNEGRVEIEFCKAEGRTVTQQLAAAMLKGRKQARVQVEKVLLVEEEME